MIVDLIDKVKEYVIKMINNNENNKENIEPNDSIGIRPNYKVKMSHDLESGLRDYIIINCKDIKLNNVKIHRVSNNKSK